MALANSSKIKKFKSELFIPPPKVLEKST